MTFTPAKIYISSSTIEYCLFFIEGRHGCMAMSKNRFCIDCKKAIDDLGNRSNRCKICYELHRENYKRSFMRRNRNKYDNAKINERTGTRTTLLDIVLGRNSRMQSRLMIYIVPEDRYVYDVGYKEVEGCEPEMRLEDYREK